MKYKKNENSRTKSLLQKYYDLIISQEFLLKKNYKNVLQIPKLLKVTINISSKVVINDRKYIVPALIAVELITGQKSNFTLTKKSISAFKCRKNQLIGCTVSLKGYFMYIFLEKMVRILLSQSRNYSGIYFKNFDPQGNYTFGIKNLLLFPELDNHFEFFEYIKGLDITIVTSAKNKKEAALLFSCLQLPII